MYGGNALDDERSKEKQGWWNNTALIIVVAVVSVLLLLMVSFGSLMYLWMKEMNDPYYYEDYRTLYLGGGDRCNG